MKEPFLDRADYEEPRCPLCAPTDVTPIPVGRVISRLDEYLSVDDTAGAERHLLYWLREADAGADRRGRLSVVNELVGFYRKAGKEQESLSYADEALALVDELGLGDTATAGTTLINAATAYKAFGRAKDALPLYERALALYEDELAETDGRMAALCNNMALALVDLGDFDRAAALFDRALMILSHNPGTQPEMAVTYCNLCDLAEARDGAQAAEETVNGYLERAYALLNEEGVTRDGNYAFVCDKCASSFGYHGFFLYEKELKERARRIYEGA